MTYQIIRTNEQDMGSKVGGLVGGGMAGYATQKAYNEAKEAERAKLQAEIDQHNVESAVTMRGQDFDLAGRALSGGKDKGGKTFEQSIAGVNDAIDNGMAQPRQGYNPQTWVGSKQQWLVEFGTDGEKEINLEHLRLFEQKQYKDIMTAMSEADSKFGTKRQFMEETMRSMGQNPIPENVTAMKSEYESMVSDYNNLGRTEGIFVLPSKYRAGIENNIVRMGIMISQMEEGMARKGKAAVQPDGMALGGPTDPGGTGRVREGWEQATPEARAALSPDAGGTPQQFSGNPAFQRLKSQGMIARDLKDIPSSDAIIRGDFSGSLEESMAGIETPPTAPEFTEEEMDDTVDKLAEAYKFPPEVIAAVIMTENEELDTKAVGKDGERGLMQVMQATAKDMGFGNFDDMFNPHVNMTAGTMYMRDRMDTHGIADGDWGALYAAYNSGAPRKNSKGQYVNQNGNTVVDGRVKRFLDNLKSIIAEHRAEAQEVQSGR